MINKLLILVRRISLKFILGYSGRRISIPSSCTIRGGENIDINDNFKCEPDCKFLADGKGRVYIGTDVSLNFNVMINAGCGGSIHIEDNVIIGPNVVIRAADHRYDNINKKIKDQGHNANHVHIGDGTWIAANVVIFGDAWIGKDCVIGAGAIVNKEVPDNTILIEKKEYLRLKRA